MGKKHCEDRCQPPYVHVHTYCIYTQVDKCHRHIIRGVTSPAPDTPGHKHEYEGVTSCNDGHIHQFHGCTCKPQYMCSGHVHNFEGKTSCENDHRHCYQGTTERDRRSFCR
ncbi:MAG TPA: hypothetical protein DDW50_16660 [Firmicutes bacterium]|jgi:hypothetical protein|nr:hypothetical protein [Bacillota bacterium]